jgi:hypothetical protein
VDSAARRLGLTAPAPDQIRLAREYITADGTGRGASLGPATTDELEKTGRP